MNKTLSKNEPIAVIGMEGIFAGAPDIKTFWQNIMNGVCSIGDPLPSWNADLYLNQRGATSTQKGGYLKDLYRFKPVDFGIMPNAVDGGEPDQFLALSVAHKALSDAGAKYLNDEYDHSETGIILGHSPYYHRGQINTAQHHVFTEQFSEIMRAVMPDMTDQQELELNALIRKQLPQFNADISPALVPNVMTGRIANRLNLRGPNYMIDAACASSLLSVQAAIEELRNGNSRMMLVGGVNASLPAEVAIIFTQLDALSDSGKVRPFSDGADGTLLGEGLGVVVLKKLSDAIADDDKIYSVIHGVGQSSDGKGFGLLTPSQMGETLAMQRAYDQTGIDPGSLSLVEAHGTGIRLGDTTEIGAMKSIFGKRRGAQGTIAIGSVKSMISHCIPAAGVASLIKTSLALHHKIQPQTLCETIEPSLGIQDTEMFVNTATRPWYHSPNEPRRAGINSFGFGGVNAHAILEEAPKQTIKSKKLSPWSDECMTFVGETSAALITQLDQLDAYLDVHKNAPLADLAFTTWTAAKKNSGTHRLSLTVKNQVDLGKKIAFARKKLNAGKGIFSTRTGVHYQNAPLDGKLAFMMPGEGSQYMHMLADLAQHFEPVRGWLDFWYGLKRDADTQPLTDFVYPIESELSNESRVSLNQTLHSMTVGSEAAFIAGQAMHALMVHLGVSADAIVGHSTGESGALLAAGVVEAKTNEDMVINFNKITEISKMMENDGVVPTGALLAVGLLDVVEISQIADEFGAVIAMENCPNQIIVYSHIDRVNDLSAALSDQGAVCELLPFDRGYHTSEFKPMQKAFESFYGDLGMHMPKLDLYSCAAADVFPSNPDGILELAAKQWSHKVRFVDTIKKMYADGVRYFVEVGPGGKLTSFAEQILATTGNKENLLIAASNQHNQTGMQVLLSLMGRLFVNDRVDLDQLFADRDVVNLDLSDLKIPKPAGMFVDNSIPRVTPTPELVGFLQALLPAQRTMTPSISSTADYPFLSAIQNLSKDRLTAQVQMDVQTQRYLQDHVLSGPVGLEHDLYGLPCVPLMCSLEIMAEAAAALLNRKDLTVIEHVFGERWIALEDDQSQLDVFAELATDANSVKVYITYQGQRSVSATFKFGAPNAPATELPTVTPTQEYCAPGAYETYREHIFHGPVFQSIEYVTAWSDKGIEATLSDVDLNGFFTDDQTPDLILNPVLYDAFTQITAFWLAQEIGPHFASFPCSIERIDIFGSVKDRCDDLILRAQRGGQLTEGQDGVWNIACYHNDQPIVRIHGLKNAFSRLPAQYYHYSLEPVNGWMGHPTDIKDGIQWTVPQLPDEFWHRLGGVFLKVLAFSNLNAEERTEWRNLPEDLSQRAAWLLPRVAIKEAMRYWLHTATGEFIYATEIPLHATQSGALMPFGEWFETFEVPNLQVLADDQTIYVTVTNNTTSVTENDFSETV
jgi:acyl transferase domain-containing protein